MRFWVVEPPRDEYDGDGEDTREWFNTRAAAERRFNEVVKSIRQHQKAVDRCNRYTAGSDKWAEAHRKAEETDPGFACNLVTLDRYDIPTTREPLRQALDSQLYPCATTVRTFPEEEK